MQKRNQLFDDLAKLTKGYVSILGEFKNELDHFVSNKFQKLVIDMKLVNRDDFEVVKEMLAEIRKEQKRIVKRLNDLEARLRKKDKSHL